MRSSFPSKEVLICVQLRYPRSRAMTSCARARFRTSPDGPDAGQNCVNRRRAASSPFRASFRRRLASLRNRSKASPVDGPIIETQLLYFAPAVRMVRQQLGFICQLAGEKNSFREPGGAPNARKQRPTSWGVCQQAPTGWLRNKRFRRERHGIQFGGRQSFTTGDALAKPVPPANDRRERIRALHCGR